MRPLSGTDLWAVHEPPLLDILQIAIERTGLGTALISIALVVTTLPGTNDLIFRIARGAVLITTAFTFF